MPFPSKAREDNLSTLQDIEFDLLVIGGGITGAGIALDAAVRGLKVGVVDKADFAAGTSSKSTKLIHGGLRYLKQYEWRLVREVGKERAILHKLAPHLVTPEQMLLPITENGQLGKTLTSLGLYVYDFIAKVKKSDRRMMLSKHEALKTEPLLEEKNVLGAGLYTEYRTDDARLTLEVLKTASRKGAIALNYVKAEDFVLENGTIAGVKALDVLSGSRFQIGSKHIVNAAGPWVDDVRKNLGQVTGKRLILTKGIHIVIEKNKLPVKQSVYFDHPFDNRMIFAIPRNNVIYIGTTDTLYNGPKEYISITESEVRYLLSAVNTSFTTPEISISDIISSWAGLRPLIFEEGRAESEISRKDEIFVSREGLITIAGGKLTGYRRMAQRVVDMVMNNLEGTTLVQCTTDEVPLTSNPLRYYSEVLRQQKLMEEQLLEKHLNPADANHLLHCYGNNAWEIIDELPSPATAADLAVAELNYTVAFEAVVHPLDFLIRRSGYFYFRPMILDQIIPAVLNRWQELFSISVESMDQLDREVREAQQKLLQFE